MPLGIFLELLDANISTIFQQFLATQEKFLKAIIKMPAGIFLELLDAKISTIFQQFLATQEKFLKALRCSRDFS